MKDLRKSRRKNECSESRRAACCEQKLWISLRVQFAGLLISKQGKFLQMSMTTMKVHCQIAPLLKRTASDVQKPGAMALSSCSHVRYFTADTVISCCAHLVCLEPPQYNICCVCGDLLSDRLLLSVTPPALQ